MTLNNINLLEKFRELKARPHTKSGFNAVVISETSPHRLGITSEGYPIFSSLVLHLNVFQILTFDFSKSCSIADVPFPTLLPSQIFKVHFR